MVNEFTHGQCVRLVSSGTAIVVTEYATPSEYIRLSCLDGVSHE